MNDIEECIRQCEAAGHDERLADGKLYLRAAALLKRAQPNRASLQNSEAEKDAARYRWLRATEVSHEYLAVARYEDIPSGIRRYLGLPLDTAIDAALAKAKP